ncbi:MAG: hypothetical protein WC966_02235 [Bradymonadales bacterium]
MRLFNHVSVLRFFLLLLALYTGFAGLISCQESDKGCIPNAKRCKENSNTPQICSADGKVWMDQSACADSSPICKDGDCVGYCARNATRCKDGSNTPQHCDPDTNTWVDQTPCADPAPICQQGRCKYKFMLCAPYAMQCHEDGKTPQMCHRDGMSWIDREACPAQSPSCEYGGCKYGSVLCVPDAKRCDPHSFLPQRCSSDGLSWIDQTECTHPTPLCKKGECVKSSAGPSIDTFKPLTGPVQLKSGDTLTGYHITSTNGPCVWGHDLKDVRITNNIIGPCGEDAKGVGVLLERSSDVRVDHNYITDVASGFYAQQEGKVLDNLVFDHNFVTKVRGPGARGQMLQFNAAKGSGHKVLCNISYQGSPGYKLGPGDQVNIFMSSGTADSPILIAYNKILGGGPHEAGGGLLAADFGGDYITIRNNFLLNPGQYGVAIAGGKHNKLLDNIMYSDTVFPWSNVAVIVWGQGNSTSPETCNNHEVRGNRVFYLSKNGFGGAWNGKNCGEVAGWDDNTFVDTSLSSELQFAEFPECAES